MRNNPGCLAALLCVALCFDSSAAEQTPIRVAVGPYFAPVQDAALQSTADAIPELLTAELSGNARFQLVERAQVNAVVKELQLSAEGLTSTDTVLKLGKLLSADWMISGAIAPSQTSTQIWTKVIDMRSGVVLDLQAMPLSKDMVTSLIEVGRFVAKAGRSNAAPRQFVALGPFRDYSMTAGRPDWSRELQFSLEKQFRERGFGVVERDAISMIAQELDLSSQGLTTPQTNRVKMQPAFWLVDGGSQWLDVSGTKLSITLRMQKVGASETMLRLTNAPGPAMDQAIRTGLSQVFLAAMSGPSHGTAPNESKVQATRGYELATGRNQLSDPNYLNSARGDVQTARRDNANMAVQRYEAAVALNPNDLEAKHMLGYALCANPDTMERGKQLLWEVVKKKDPKYVTRSLTAIAMAELYEPGPTPDSRMSFRPPDLEQQKILLTNGTDLAAKFKLGSSLLGYQSERNQKRGVAYLEDVARSARNDLRPSAERALAEYRRRPPELRSRSRQGKTFPGTEATPMSAIAPEAQPAPARPEMPLKPEKSAETALREFLQKHFSRAMPVQFQKDGPQVSVFHRLSLKDNMLEFNGRYYCGFRFTVPTWMDGNFKWMELLAKSEAQREFTTSTFGWVITSKADRMNTDADVWRIDVQRYKNLRQRFPFTQVFFQREMAKEQFKPGHEYAIWYSFAETDLPDIEFSIAIASRRGYDQFGFLPMQ